MENALQFICRKCHVLANVQSLERTADGLHYCRCRGCGAKNAVVHIGASLCQPGILPVMRLLE